MASDADLARRVFELSSIEEDPANWDDALAQFTIIKGLIGRLDICRQSGRVPTKEIDPVLNGLLIGHEGKENFTNRAREIRLLLERRKMIIEDWKNRFKASTAFQEREVVHRLRDDIV